MIRRLFRKHQIVTPSRILADLVALKVASYPADPSAPYKAQGTHKLELRGGGLLFINIESGWVNGSGLGITYANRSMPGFYHPIEMSLTADNQHTDIDLSEEEQAIISEQFQLWHERSVALMESNQAARSQKAALKAVEGLI